MTKRSEGKSDLQTDIESWLASNSVDHIADYVARGRRHSALQDDALFDAWKSAMQGMAAQPASEHRALQADLAAEIELRGLKAPYDDVKDAVERFTLHTADVVKKLMQDPDELERVNDEIMKDVQEFKNKRDRPQ